MADLDFAEKQEAERNKRRVYASRFTDGWQVFRARLYRRMAEEHTPPPVVDLMTPSQCAALLRLDETDEVIAGPLDADGQIAQLVRARSADAVPAPERRPVDRTKKRTERLKDYLAQQEARVN